MNAPARFICLFGLIATVSCAGMPPFVQTEQVGPLPPQSARDWSGGVLVVYSARHSGTVGQSEYPLHTDYRIRGPGGRSTLNVANQAGLFAQDPVPVKLLPGEYQVEALVEGGGYVVVPVIVEAGERTIVDLDGAVMPQDVGSDSRWVRLPDGQVVGWQAHGGMDTQSSR
jgi:hypothetical protein